MWIPDGENFCSKGPLIATQLNSTPLDVELSSVELSCVAIDTTTDATQLSPAIGNATDPVAAYSQSARSRSVSRVELSCVAINEPLELDLTKIVQFFIARQHTDARY